MVEKADAGADLRLAHAIEIELDDDAGFLGCALDAAFTQDFLRQYSGKQLEQSIERTRAKRLQAKCSGLYPILTNPGKAASSRAHIRAEEGSR